MNKYLFLLDALPPTRSANGICAQKVMKILAQNAPVYCVAWDAGDPTENSFCQCSRIPAKPWARRAERLRQDTTALGKFRFFMARCLYWLKRFCMLGLWPVDSLSTAGNFYREAKKRIEEEGITHVVAVCFPGETLLACKWLKKTFGNRIQTFLFPMDITLQGKSDGTKPEKYLSRLGARHFLKRCAREADGLLVLENAEELYREVFPESQRRNHILCGIPMLQKWDSKQIPAGTAGEIRCLYAGHLFADLRDPTCLFDILESCSRQLRETLTVEIYGAGDASVFKGWENRYSGIRILCHGWVSEDRLDAALEQADVLINVGNIYDHLIPSKLFKYMNTGKPILHQTVSEGDPCLPYLKRYENALTVDARKPDMEQTQTLAQFLRERKTIPGQAFRLFPRCTPEYAARVISGEEK